MAKEKITEIAEMVLAKSRVGLISWEETADDNTFLAPLPGGSVTVARSTFRPFPYAFKVLDSQGRVLESVSSDPKAKEAAETNLHGNLKEVHDLARRSALKIEQTLDHILEGLKKS